MAAPAWATNLSDIYTGGAGSFSALGGGQAGLNTETDDFLEGTDCKSKNAWTNAIKGLIHNHGSSFTVPTTGAIIAGIRYDVPSALEVREPGGSPSNGGIMMIEGSAVGAYNRYNMAGSDTLTYTGWDYYAVDPNTATADDTVGTPSGTEQWVGVEANLPTTSGPTKGAPIRIDVIRYGRVDIEYTAGDLGNGYNTFSGAATYADAGSRRWGVLVPVPGTTNQYYAQGFHSWGTSGTAVDLRDSNKIINIRDTPYCAAGFNRFELINASSNLDLDNIIFQALGTQSPGTFVHTAGTWKTVNCQYVDVGTLTFLATADLTSSVFRGTDTITAPGSTMLGTKVIAPTVSADTGALVYNSATNPNGKLDNMVFEQGAAAHHAIDFGTLVTGNITLTGITFDGFDETTGEDQPGAALRFLATSGSLTCSLVGCTVGGVAANATNFFKDDAAGIAVTLVFDTIPLKITVIDAVSKADLADARVYLHKVGDTGTVYFEDETDANGEVNDAIAYPGDTAVVGWVREMSQTGTDYIAKDISGTITDTGLDLLVELEPLT